MSGTYNDMGAKFNALVKSLDHGALDALRRSVASEIKGRGGSSGVQGDMGRDNGGRDDAGRFEAIQDDAIHIQSIRPGMSAGDKERAAQEIARVLREG
jgi:hypothetical protein